MTNASKMIDERLARVLVVGFPGSAKTGGLASLANAGFKIRMLDFEGNNEAFLAHVKPEFLQNIDICYLKDEMHDSSSGLAVRGVPTAFRRALKLMDHWKYTDKDDEVVDLGHSKDWGRDTIVVLDSLTAMGERAMEAALSKTNRTILNRSDGVWGYAMAEQQHFIDKLTSRLNNHHLIVISHLVMIGPKDVRKGENPVTEKIKEQLADLIDTRYYPSALGWKLPQQIGGAFSTIVRAEAIAKGNSIVYRLRTMPRKELDLKVPAASIPTDLDLAADGMLRLFKSIGCNPPNHGESE
jgi:hypothetical protein